MKKSRSKFNVSSDKSKRTYDGIIFDSELEMKYYRDVVKPSYESGDITYFELQRKYELQPKYEHNGEKVRSIDYVADFYIIYKDGSEKVIDTKGMPDSVAKLKRKLFWFIYPNIDYEWICYSKIDGGWCEYDYVQEQRKKRKKNKLKENSKSKK